MLSCIIFVRIENVVFKKTMTKTVGSAGTPQRAGDGARPVLVVHSEESTQSVLFSPNAWRSVVAGVRRNDG